MEDICDQCQAEANVFCAQCSNSYCTACNLQRHRIGKRKDHTVSKEEQWELISDLLVVFKPSQVATTALCEKQRVSVFCVLYGTCVNGLVRKHVA